LNQIVIALYQNAYGDKGHAFSTSFISLKSHSIS